jgi:hypothetical protein
VKSRGRLSEAASELEAFATTPGRQEALLELHPLAGGEFPAHVCVHQVTLRGKHVVEKLLVQEQAVFHLRALALVNLAQQKAGQQIFSTRYFFQT